MFGTVFVYNLKEKIIQHNIMRKFTLLTTLLLSATMLMAQYTDERLFADYLRRDLSSWGEYIDATDWNKIDTKERLRLINYEYGWIATAIDSQSPKSKEYLANFFTHIEQIRPEISQSTYCTYLSAAYAYEFMLDKSKLFSAGLKSFNLCKEAVEHDNTDPIALTLKGNVDFYAPKAFGGNKEKALDYFLKAKKYFKERGNYKYLWNYWSMEMCIAQCYEKTGRLDEAIAQCRAILAQNPDFTYIRDEYLPELLKKK